MRLLHFDSSERLTQTNFSGKTIPPYAILSHTWGGDEFLFEDLVNGTGKSKVGYEKILFSGEQAARDHLQYFWVDTCCIDKWNLRELSSAINSMFRWYRNASKCYVYLSDISTPITDEQLHQSVWEASFRKSRWFTRGWTLQELIAPASVEFFSLERRRLGDKESLEQQVYEITGIPVAALRGDPLENFSVGDRRAWTVGRQTTQEEDIAYSLIGIFGVSMEFRYGEGKERALNRLQEEMEKANTTPFIVPFDRNARFVGRESQLADLRRKLFVGVSITKVAITGSGGIGKTQLALELAYRIREEFKNCLVFWIPTSDMESLHQAYAYIAQRLSIPGWDDEKADVKKLVQLYLSKESAGQWLLVFDITDEARLETAESSQAISLIEYLPVSDQGAIVFTTTDRITAVTLALQDIVELPEIEQDLAQRMLKMCLISPANEQEVADLLLKELAYLPLAIVQAAAYINFNKITLRQYLLLLAEQKKKVVKPISKECENAIATTWLISFEQIRHQDTLAADYLLFMACVDPTDVPLALLPATSPREKGIDAVGTLDAYSFVTKRTAESALDLHRLVHLSTRNWLKNQELLSQWTQVAITRLLEVFPDSNHGNRSKWRRLLPHTTFALSFGHLRQENGARTNLVYKYATALFSDGRFNEAELYFNDALQSWKEMFGQEYPNTLTSMAMLASTYWNQGRWKEAEDLEVQVMETSKRVLGQEHPNTLTSIANLASTYRNQGRWKEAEDLEVQVIETRKKVLGQEHPNTLTSIANLASTYKYQGRWKEAEELQATQLEICSRNQGRWKEAEDLEVQVMETRKKVLGQEHPDTLTSIANLAATYWNQGCWKEAEDFEVQVMETSKRVLGQEHPNTLTSMTNLASTYQYQERWKEAEELQATELEICSRVLGQEHPDTLTSMANLALIWKRNSRDIDALKLMKQCVEARARILGANHPYTLSSSTMLVVWQTEELEISTSADR
ncbi:uncharacterized protein BP5553_09241 [Venustampulla echinocandica]|uniref:Heterokaryon incompatibility domain-containing protein n=1 Tax=Venustampulla echinocandica TaxID=2656787 RepID=A0A370TC58_9HELO|nr:uncharacterized protein BP5553_09241 [Venustampulla echinocandica]RDL31839.1 hypothetical protein BP5553_09241 [Venustampulla echinocandica]